MAVLNSSTASWSAKRNARDFLESYSDQIRVINELLIIKGPYCFYTDDDKRRAQSEYDGYLEMEALAEDAANSLDTVSWGMGPEIKGVGLVYKAGKGSKIAWGAASDIPIIKQLAGRGQLRDLRNNPNLRNVNINDLLEKTPSQLEDMAKRGEISAKTLKQIKKAFEGRDLGE